MATLPPPSPPDENLSSKPRPTRTRRSTDGSSS
jgi:hypothetical protein